MNINFELFKLSPPEVIELIDKAYVKLGGSQVFTGEIDEVITKYLEMEIELGHDGQTILALSIKNGNEVVDAYPILTIVEIDN